MSFFEVETWKPKAEYEVEHHEMVRRWFKFVNDNFEDMFPEWKSARYFKQVDRYTGEFTGRYVMIFEYISHEAFLAYKERRRDWSGPYEAYQKVDPYQFFDMDTVTEEYWKPNEEHLWLDFSKDKKGK